MRECVAKWFYKDGTSHVVGYVCRFEDGSFKDSGKPSKDIIPYFIKDGNVFKGGLPNSFKEKRPLYGLESVTDPLKPVYITEGEKCASALKDLGVQSVTSLGGCSSVLKADWEKLKDIREVILLPDNDEAGERYSEAIYKRLKNINPLIAISLIVFPDLPKGGDVCDFLIRISL
ncbi:MAG: toprim domain-containing protein [Alphaproteobacteria bacterium]|nr:toprim domain-containing protein [Alphaproteobacteria bacterium]